MVANPSKRCVQSIRTSTPHAKRVSKSFRNEVVTWKCLRHPNVVPFLGISDRFPVCLVSEWMPGGTISAFLVEHPEENRSRYVRVHGFLLDGYITDLVM
jgi:serine/threonine protein kinase